MSVDRRELTAYINRLEQLKRDMPALMNELTVGEGVYAVKQAKLICKNDPSEPKQQKLGIVNTGAYRRNFKSDKKAARAGNTYSVRVFNNLDYAQHLEYGFRSHFVPGKHLSGPIRSSHPNGIYVGKPGGYVRGHFTMRRAKERTEATQGARLRRKLGRFVNARFA